MTDVFLDGVWRTGRGPAFESLDPVRGDCVWRGRAASQADVDKACDAARRALGPWYRAGLETRMEIARIFATLLAQRSEDMARIMARETGKALWDCRQELDAAVNKVEISIRSLQARAGNEFQEQKGASRALHHKPHGVIAVYGPFNFPVHLPNGHIVPALLAGNTVVFKPSELAPECASRYLDCWHDAGLQGGVLNLVQGGRDTGGWLMDNRELDGLLFTGSAATGEFIHRHFAGRTGKILALELGGNNPLVLSDAEDPLAAALLIVQSAFLSAGQRCTCARRLIALDTPANRALIEGLETIMDSIRVDDPLRDPQPFMGSLINAASATRILDHQQRLLDMGATALRACRTVDTGPALLTPGLIDVSAVDATPDEEAFGPILQLRWVADLGQAIAEANRTRFGLSAGIICGQSGDWERFLVESRAGVVNRNLPLTGASSAMPFGGIGASGNLRPSAFYAADYCAYPVASLIRDQPGMPDSLPPGIEL